MSAFTKKIRQQKLKLGFCVFLNVWRMVHVFFCSRSWFSYKIEYQQRKNVLTWVHAHIRFYSQRNFIIAEHDRIALKK